MAESVTSRMSQYGQPARRVNRTDHTLGTQSFTDHGITAVVGLQIPVIEFEAERQYMHQTTLEKRADLHAAPQGGYGMARLALSGQPGPHGVMCMGAVVIGHGEMGQN